MTLLCNAHSKQYFSTGAHSRVTKIWFVNILDADKRRVPTLTPCAGCFGRFCSTQYCFDGVVRKHGTYESAYRS